MRRRHQRIETHPENWVQDEPTVGRLYADGDELRLEHQGYEYRVEAAPVEAPEEYGGGFYRISVFEGSSEHPTARAVKFGKDAYWDAYDGDSLSHAFIHRQHRDPIAAILKVLSSVV
jgi:hypothetical protein